MWSLGKVCHFDFREEVKERKGSQSRESESDWGVNRRKLNTWSSFRAPQDNDPQSQHACQSFLTLKMKRRLFLFFVHLLWAISKLPVWGTVEFILANSPSVTPCNFPVQQPLTWGGKNTLPLPLYCPYTACWSTGNHNLNPSKLLHPPSVHVPRSLIKYSSTMAKGDRHLRVRPLWSD